MNDKLKHVLVGALIAVLVSLVFGDYAGLAAATFAGGLKEGWDQQRGGKFDFLDWGATVLGGLVVFL